jgi:hypothetical protein
MTPTLAPARANDRWLVVTIAVLALADGILHLALATIFSARFGTRFLTSTLGVLFILNFLGYLVLAGAYLFGRGRLGSRAWLLDIVLVIYAAASIAIWVWYGRPNPMQAGYPSKALEVLLLIAAAAHLWRSSRGRSPASVGSARAG